MSFLSAISLLGSAFIRAGSRIRCRMNEAEKEDVLRPFACRVMYFATASVVIVTNVQNVKDSSCWSRTILVGEPSQDEARDTGYIKMLERKPDILASLLTLHYCHVLL